MKSKKRIVLAYSGGLDTSIILKWLQENYNAEVICYTADIGQEINRKKIVSNAKKFGVKNVIIKDLKDIFVKDYVFPMIRGHAVYEGVYLLGTSIARPLIAKRQIAIAKKFKAFAVSHGSTGKGNDQVRFELGYAFFGGEKIRVIAPWREWKIQSREDALAYVRSRNIDIQGIDENKLFSRDENLWHISHEGGPLEDPGYEPEESIFQWTVSAENAPDCPEMLEIEFNEGYPVAINGKNLDSIQLLEALNQKGSEHGIGRIDLVEDRLVGMKSRGLYETPGGTLLHVALRELEQLTLDRRTLSLKDELAPRYADLVYEGWWWNPEREAIDAAVNTLMEHVTGKVCLKLYKGVATVVSRSSPKSLYDAGFASFGEDQRFAHSDAEGFIRLFGLPARVRAERNSRG